MVDMGALRDNQAYLVVYLPKDMIRASMRQIEPSNAARADHDKVPLHQTFCKVLRDDSTSNNELYCPFVQCGLEFRDIGALKTHVREHLGARNFKCTFEGCTTSFKTNGHLKTHILIHTGERPFACDICGLSYARKSRLKIHLRKHTGEKPFKCEICQGSFTEKGNLKTHMRIHNGDKPYRCDAKGCDMAFTTLGHL